MSELGGGKDAVSEARSGARRVAYLFTDGAPTLPLGTTKENVQLTIAQASRAAAAGVRIHTYEFGAGAELGMTEQIARASGGSYRRIDTSVLETRAVPVASLVNLKSLALENRSTGEAARELEVGLDGSFFALVPMRAGANQLAVVARLGDDRQIEVTREVQFDASAPEPALDVVQSAARERLLGRRGASPQP